MAKIKRYTKEELDYAAEKLISAGKDVEFVIKGQKFILDIKRFAAQREFNKKHNL